MFCVPHFMFNSCTFRQVEGKRTGRQAFRALPLTLCLMFLCSVLSADLTCIKLILLLFDMLLMLMMMLLLMLMMMLFSRGGVVVQLPPTMELRHSINH